MYHHQIYAGFDHIDIIYFGNYQVFFFFFLLTPVYEISTSIIERREGHDL